MSTDPKSPSREAATLLARACLHLFLALSVLSALSVTAHFVQVADVYTFPSPASLLVQPHDAFLCTLCGHAIQSVNGHGLHRDAFACFQCEATLYPPPAHHLSMENVTHNINRVLAPLDVPPSILAVARSLLLLEPVAIHPFALLCFVFALLVLWLYLGATRGVYRQVVALRDRLDRQHRHVLAQKQLASPLGNVLDSPHPPLSDLCYDEGPSALRQRHPLSPVLS